MIHALAALDLWTAARRTLAQVLYLVGAATPAAIALLSRREREDLRIWVSGLEAMVRKLLLIEAERLAPAAPRQRGLIAPGTVGPGASRSRPPSFALVPASARERKHPARIRQLGAPLLLRDLWRDARRDARIERLRAAPRAGQYVRMANRIAALARVIAKPVSHARRLCKLLRRNAATAMAAIVAARAPRRPTQFQSAAFDRAHADAARIDPASFARRR